MDVERSAAPLVGNVDVVELPNVSATVMSFAGSIDVAGYVGTWVRSPRIFDPPYLRTWPSGTRVRTWLGTCVPDVTTSLPRLRRGSPSRLLPTCRIDRPRAALPCRSGGSCPSRARPSSRSGPGPSASGPSRSRSPRNAFPFAPWRPLARALIFDSVSPSGSPSTISQTSPYILGSFPADTSPGSTSPCADARDPSSASGFASSTEIFHVGNEPLRSGAADFSIANSTAAGRVPAQSFLSFSNTTVVLTGRRVRGSLWPRSITRTSVPADRW